MISVVAPMFNEEAGIAANIQLLLDGTRDLPEPVEIVLVNDGSTDKTETVVRELARGEPRIRLVTYRRNRGRGYALRRGIEAARGSFVMTTESDLSYGADIVGRLYRAIVDEDLDMVIASPYMPGGRLENVPWKRAFLSRWGNRVLSVAARGRLTTLTGMTRGYRREVLEAIEIESEGKEIHLEIASKVMALGFRIGEIPATLRWKAEKKGAPKRRSTLKAGRTIASHLLFGFDEYPLMLFGGVGFILMLLGAAIAVYAWYLGFFHGVRVAQRPIVLGAILFLLFGGQTLAFSFLASQNRSVRNRLVRLEAKLLELGRNRVVDERDSVPPQEAPHPSPVDGAAKLLELPSSARQGARS